MLLYQSICENTCILYPRFTSREHKNWHKLNKIQNRKIQILHAFCHISHITHRFRMWMFVIQTKQKVVDILYYSIVSNGCCYSYVSVWQAVCICVFRIFFSRCYCCCSFDIVLCVIVIFCDGEKNSAILQCFNISLLLLLLMLFLLAMLFFCLWYIAA